MQYIIMLTIVLGLALSDFATGIIKGYIKNDLNSTKMRKDGLMPGAVTANTPQRASYPIPYTKYVEFRQDISRSDYDSDEAYQSALTADLRAQAQEYVNVHQYPEVTYTVGAALEKLSDVGERVVVIDERMGLTLDTRVISYDYNCLIGKVTETKFGTLPPKLSAVISQINSLSSRVNAIGG